MAKLGTLDTVLRWITRGNRRLKSVFDQLFDMQSDLLPGRPQIFTGFYCRVSVQGGKKAVDDDDDG